MVLNLGTGGAVYPMTDVYVTHPGLCASSLILIDEGRSRGREVMVTVTIENSS